jgi:hypothetical protein
MGFLLFKKSISYKQFQEKCALFGALEPQLNLGHRMVK